MGKRKVEKEISEEEEDQVASDLDISQSSGGSEISPELRPQETYFFGESPLVSGYVRQHQPHTLGAAKCIWLQT